MTPAKIKIYDVIIDSDTEDGEYNIEKHKYVEIYFFQISAVNKALTEDNSEVTQIHANNMLYTSPWPLKKILSVIEKTIYKHGFN